jgi:hypothetical protein
MMCRRVCKLVVAIFLLPVCAILSQTFYRLHPRDRDQQLWAGESSLFFPRAVLWLIAFFASSTAAGLRFRTS